MNVLIVYYSDHHENIIEGLEILLKTKGINYTLVDRINVAPKFYHGKDFVIVIGGDGTFMRANHYNRDLSVIGINPDPTKKEGFYMQLDKEDYLKFLPDILEGKYKKIRLLRLHIEINGIHLEERALNEVYVGDDKPYTVFNYDILVKNRTEFQRSSGVLIGTPSGSHAWLKSAGGVAMALGEKRYQYLVREPYEGKLTKNYKLLKGIMGIDQTVELVSRSPGILVYDAMKEEIPLKIGDRIKVYPSKDFLNYILVN